MHGAHSKLLSAICYVVCLVFVDRIKSIRISTDWCLVWTWKKLSCIFREILEKLHSIFQFMMYDSSPKSSRVLFRAKEMETKKLSLVPEVNVCSLTWGLHNMQKFVKFDSTKNWKTKGKKTVGSLTYFCGIEQTSPTFEIMWPRVCEEPFGYYRTWLEAKFLLSKWCL